MGFWLSDEDSWSDGEQEPLTVDQTWRGDPDSEADSIDSDQEDPLKWVMWMVVLFWMTAER